MLEKFRRGGADKWIGHECYVESIEVGKEEEDFGETGLFATAGKIAFFEDFKTLVGTPGLLLSLYSLVRVSEVIFKVDVVTSVVLVDLCEVDSEGLDAVG